ncbi:unnamed protein product [Chrysodeixis includens]|uniref:HTTM-like domain-containing protein n=1 Tax=Chrysodeixis includens TaxID=689277 RepID=A0A9P0C1V5_CHRIL|nr:unnamed protein product [Chrysodeixis includens]
MKAKEIVLNIYQKVDDKFVEQFGFKIKDVTFEKLIVYMYCPKDSSSLAFTRILFGLAMLFDIPDERGGAIMDKRWGDPGVCHFPLFPFLKSVGMPYMAVVYAALWLGALGIMLGYKYRLAAPLFTACHWYLFLIEKSYWNNHSYLFGLVALLLCFTEAECYWSLDAYLDPRKKKTSVPYWNYFLLKYQFFILYFMAGMKKGTAEWLAGYSVMNLSEHWVFAPFKYFLTVPQTDYLVVHCFVFVFDLTVAIWMMWSSTRNVAMVFCAMFHFMNSRLFRIGMFPWVCLATMPLFYPFDWPNRIISATNNHYTKLKAYIFKKITECKIIPICRTIKPENENNDESAKTVDKPSTNDEETKMIEENMKSSEDTVSDEILNPADEIHQENNQNDLEARKSAENDATDIKNDLKHYDEYKKKRRTMYWIALYVFLQAFLPYSHFITKGYNNWTDGLYGYSWDMMVHTWDVRTMVIRAVDNDNNREIYIDSQRHAPNDRWSRHGDMVYQYAHCLNSMIDPRRSNSILRTSSKNISIYFEIWCSLNGRFVQRMFDSKADILKASWGPFSEVSYLMPMIDGVWRGKLDEIRNHVHSWSENSDVVFYADFPGYEQEKFIPIELRNVTLTVLEGKVVYETPGTHQKIGQSFMLNEGNRLLIESGKFHKVLNVDEKPVFYMYNFYNSSESGAAGGFVCQIENEGDTRRGVKRVHSSFPLAAVTSHISSGSSRRLVTVNK